MSKTAFTKEEFETAATALVNQGVRPTVRKLRQILGGGSHETLTPLLSDWLGRQAETQTAHAPVPASVQDKAISLATSIWAIAKAQADSEVCSLRQLHESELSGQRAELADCRLDIRDLENALTELRLELKLETERREAAQQAFAQANELARRVPGLEGELQRLQTQLEAMRGDAMRHAMDAARESSAAAALRGQLDTLTATLRSKSRSSGASPKRAAR